MEFHEKLQELRKGKGLTQEELAEVLYVSRTAISKWESGRGFPSLDSLKEISAYFDVSIDGLLSGEALLSIAEKDNRAKLRRVYDLLFGIADVLSLALILLPLYPQPVDGFIYAVNLITYSETSSGSFIIYWILIAALMAAGAVKIVLTRCRPEKEANGLSNASIAVNLMLAILLIVSRETYAAAAAVLILAAKGVLLLKNVKNIL